MPEAKDNITKIITEITQELSTNKDYGSRIQKVQLTPGGVQSPLEIDVVADLPEQMDRRGLGEVLAILIGKYRKQGVTIAFHQYGPEEYSQRGVQK